MRIEQVVRIHTSPHEAMQCSLVTISSSGPAPVLKLSMANAVSEATWLPELPARASPEQTVVFYYKSMTY